LVVGERGTGLEHRRQHLSVVEGLRSIGETEGALPTLSRKSSLGEAINVTAQAREREDRSGKDGISKRGDLRVRGRKGKEVWCCGCVARGEKRNGEEGREKLNEEGG
jgi:hypothetical protein